MVNNSFFGKKYDTISSIVTVVFALSAVLSSNMVAYAYAQQQVQPAPQLWEYCNGQNAIHILYPVDWTRVENENGVSFRSPDGMAGVYITSEESNQFDIRSPDQYAANFVASLESSGDPSLVIYHENFGWVDVGSGLPPIFGHPEGYKIQYRYNDPNLGIPIEVGEIFVTTNAPYYLYDIKFYAHPDHLANYAQTFEEMFNTFYQARSCG